MSIDPPPPSDGHERIAVALVIDDEGLLERSAAIGEVIRSRMLAWQGRWPEIGEVRGLGSMLAIELVSEPSTAEPSGEFAQRVVDAALARGLLLLTCGVYGNCIRVLVPLVDRDYQPDRAHRQAHDRGPGQASERSAPR